MKKKLFFAAVAIVALASCADNEFVGEVSPNPKVDGTNAIVFNSGSKAITRATGAEAAGLLNNNFVVEGIKTVNSTKSEVFDNYNVNYLENTADKTASNTANWEYVAQTILTGKTAAAEQTIKYWDFAASQYDFWAYSLGEGSATVSSLEPNATLSTSAYTITGTKENLAKVYISDLVTAYNPVKSVSGVSDGKTEPAVMGNEVDLTFRSLVSKVRVGLYETIPGYSVRNVLFYPASDGTAGGDVFLYASSSVLPTFDSSTNDAQYTVTFPTIGADNIGESDYNKAHVALSSDDKASNIKFGTLSYGAHQDGKKEKTGYTEGTPGTWTDIWVQRTSNTCTWATESGASAGDYSIVLPYEDGAVLTLKVDYTLESIDGTGETIVVHGATAVVPAVFTQWKANFAYTYIFKISDNTNGLTNTLNTDKIGLYPITLDAIVVGSEEETQETVTTVATPSITTYQHDPAVNASANNEYKAGDIYVMVMNGGTLMSDLNGTTSPDKDAAKLYTLSSSTVTTFTEADVMDALNKQTSVDASGNITGRNGLVLTDASTSSSLSNTITAIPGADENDITVTAGQASKFTASASMTYAYVYTVKQKSGTDEVRYEAVKPASGTDVTSYYTNTTGNTLATGPADGNTTYYAKYTVNDGVYAVKVIKVASGS